MIVDTDVLIWHLRGNARAAVALDQAGHFSISVVTFMELVAGTSSKSELVELKGALAALGAAIAPVNEAISDKAAFYVEQHFHAHGLRMADALIGATAVVGNVPLLTGNSKHYRMLSGLSLRRFRP